MSDEEFISAGVAKRYNAQVFILPPWREIFVNDDLRKLSFDESLKFHGELVKAYERLGYDLIEVPRAPVEGRMAFIQGHIAARLVPTQNVL